MLKQEPSSEVASTKRKRNEEASEVPKECPEKMFQKLPFPVRVSREKSHLMPDSLAPLSYLRRIIRVVSPFFQLAPLFYVEIPSEEIQLERAVGSGSFSNVFFSLIDGIGVACKIPFKRDIPSFSEEVNLLNSLDHPNIEKFIGIATINNKLAMITEYCFGGSLYGQLHQNFNRRNVHFTVSEKFVKNFNTIVIGIIAGIEYLHHFGYIHSDICSSNILLSREFVPKLIDFGEARLPGVSPRGVGHAEYRAPEVCRAGKRSDKSVTVSFSLDIYAFGVLLWEMLHPGTMPWEGEMDFESKVVSGSRPRICLDALQQDAKEFWTRTITACWQQQPEMRPSASELHCTISNFLK